MGGICRAFGIEPWPYKAKLGDWHFFPHIGLTEAQVAPRMDEEFYANLDWTVDGLELLDRAESVAGRSKGEVYLLTSPWNTPGCMDGKLAWVARECPRYERRLLIGAPKEACSHPGSVLIDDSETNCRKFATVRNPGHAVLLPRPWNVRHDESCTDTGRVLDLKGLFEGYADGRPSGLDKWLAIRANEKKLTANG